MVPNRFQVDADSRFDLDNDGHQPNMTFFTFNFSLSSNFGLPRRNWAEVEAEG